MNLELVESLCGFQKVIRTLDDRDLVITSLPGEVMKHGEFKSIPGEGMPVYKDPFTKGRLIIQFVVNFPKSIDPSIIPTLEQCLPPREVVIIPDGAEEVSLIDLDPEHDNRRSHQHETYKKDDSGPSCVQCATN